MDSILDRLDKGDVRVDPFPFVDKQSCLDTDLYSKLARNFPSLTFGEDAPSNFLSLTSLPDALEKWNLGSDWESFAETHLSYDFYRRLIEIFRPQIDKYYPGLEDRIGAPLEGLPLSWRGHTVQTPVKIDCQFGYNTPVTEPSRVRAIHVDKSTRLISALLYFRRSKDQTPGGDLEIYRFKRKRNYFDIQEAAVEDKDAEACGTVPYESNRLILFLNTPDSLHGVTTRDVTPYSRCYINFLVELADPIFDLAKCIGTDPGSPARVP